jgi:hypothetical protein
MFKSNLNLGSKPNTSEVDKAFDMEADVIDLNSRENIRSSIQTEEDSESDFYDEDEEEHSIKTVIKNNIPSKIYNQMNSFIDANIDDIIIISDDNNISNMFSKQNVSKNNLSKNVSKFDYIPDSSGLNNDMLNNVPDSPGLNDDMLNDVPDSPGLNNNIDDMLNDVLDSPGLNNDDIPNSPGSNNDKLPDLESVNVVSNIIDKKNVENISIKKEDIIEEEDMIEQIDDNNIFKVEIEPEKQIVKSLYCKVVLKSGKRSGEMCNKKNKKNEQFCYNHQ